MSIWIMKREHGQRTPRPFNRADDRGEMCEMIDNFAKCEMLHLPKSVAAPSIVLDNMETDEPVWVLGHCELFAFTSQF